MTQIDGLENQHLLKDLGIIPYLLQKNHDFNSVLVGYNNSIPSYPYLEKYVRGLQMNFLEDNSVESRLRYIQSHYEDMDLFILYGAYPRYLPIVDYYRSLRPDGKIYLATDMNINWADAISHNYDQSIWLKFLNQCDVIGASCRKIQRYLNMKWKVPVDLIRNGYFNAANINYDNLFAQKENIILTVGRIGTDQKNNQMLLGAFAKCYENISSWRLKFVGNITSKFYDYIENYFDLYPHLKSRVEFTGLIEDKILLAEEFKKAKIFILTSTFEGGTPNVISEALYSGDYIITTDIDGASDATDEGRCGVTVPLNDINFLSDTLRLICNNQNQILIGGVHAFKYAREYFDAEKIVARLYYLLYGNE